MKSLILLLPLALLAACDSNSSSTSASTVAPPIEDVESTPAIEKLARFSVWSGENNSEVTFEEALTGAEFYRYRDVDCDIDNYASCDSGQLNILDGNTVIDTAFNRDNSAYYQLQDPAVKSSASLNHTANKSQPLAAGGDNVVLMHNLLRTKHYDHQMLSFKNQLWVIGGYSGSVKQNNVWSSSDGLNWTLRTKNAGFSPRRYHQALVYNNKLWVIGGEAAGSTVLNDVWSSSDGVTWDQQSANAAFPKTYGHQVVVQQNKLMLIGGKDNYDVWSSTDGIEWRQGLNGAIKIN